MLRNLCKIIRNIKNSGKNKKNIELMEKNKMI